MAINLDQSQMEVVQLGLSIVLFWCAWLFYQRLSSGSTRPDPWDETVAAEIAREDCPQICHGCLTPHEPAAHFCDHCNAMVGPCTSLMPPLCYYSIGTVICNGVEGRYRRSPFLTAGYFAIGLSYVKWVLFPICLPVMLVYWMKLTQNIPNAPASTPEPPE